MNVWNYCTYVPALYEALRLTEGDVVELGVGLCSTQLLSSLGWRTRNVFSFDDDPGWLRSRELLYQQEFGGMEGDTGKTHLFRHVGSWEKAYELVCDVRPELVFVDHGTVKELSKFHTLRTAAILTMAPRLRNTLFVLHDVTEQQLDRLSSLFAFTYVDIDQSPQTAIFSNRELDTWLRELRKDNYNGNQVEVGSRDSELSTQDVLHRSADLGNDE